MEIKIETEIAEKLNAHIAKTNEFKSVEEYVHHILKQVIERLGNETKENQVYSNNDEEMIREKLKDLGYLD